MPDSADRSVDPSADRAIQSDAAPHVAGGATEEWNAVAVKLITDAALTQEFGFAPTPDAQALYDGALTKLKASKTASQIIDKLSKNPQFVINVIPTRGFPSQFMDEELNVSKKLPGSVIAWYPDSNKTPNGEQGSEIGLIHEMGHAVQYLDNRAWYKTYTRIYYDRLRQDPEVPNSDQRKKNAQLTIENDNVTKHETPVAKELAQGWREKYD